MTASTEDIIKRLSESLRPWGEMITQKKMFGGHSFLYGGKMCIGEHKEKLVVRIPAERMDEVMAMPDVGPMVFTGKPMKEFVFVFRPAYQTEEQLQFWVELGIEHAKSKLEK